MKTADFLVVGGGVVGLTLALELRRRHPTAAIVVLEKEQLCGMHASGRNSGVLHAGFYYTADSLKARLTCEGNRRLTAWCEERGVPVLACGKLVVARDESEHAGLDELLRRARHNGVALHDVTEAEARGIEPRIKTAGRALWSPNTGAVDPVEVMRSLATACEEARIELWCGVAWRGRRGRETLTTAGPVATGYLVNAAGLYATRVAHAYGFGLRYRIMPFKGLYLYGTDAAGPLATHVYPVPDLKMPFLGVHFTLTSKGVAKIGPTAHPAWWLENYQGLGPRFFEGFQFGELSGVLRRHATLLMHDASFRRHATREPLKAFRHTLVRHASELLAGVDASQFTTWGRPGIRAQLFDTEASKLEMDFRFEGDAESMHVLNAVSPAFTCSLAFAELVVDSIEAGGAS